MKALRQLGKFYLGFGLFCVVMGNFDFEFAKKYGRPIIPIPITIYQDGGTVDYSGLGYYITIHNRISGSDVDYGTSYEKGPELKPWPMYYVPGFRKLIRRAETRDACYSQDGEVIWTKGFNADEGIGKNIEDALMELFPYLIFGTLFLIHTKLFNRKKIQQVAGGDATR